MRRACIALSAATMASSPTANWVESITIRQPDDWHLHVRDGAGLRSVVPHSAAHFGRAVIMPNTQPPVTTTQQARLHHTSAGRVDHRRWQFLADGDGLASWHRQRRTGNASWRRSQREAHSSR